MLHECWVTDCVLGGWPSRSWQLCCPQSCPLWLPTGRSGLGLGGGSNLGVFSWVFGARCPAFSWACRGSAVRFLLPRRFGVGLAVECSSCLVSVLTLGLCLDVFVHWAVGGLSRGPTGLCVGEPQQNQGRGLCALITGLSPQAEPATFGFRSEPNIKSDTQPTGAQLK